MKRTIKPKVFCWLLVGEGYTQLILLFGLFVSFIAGSIAIAENSPTPFLFPLGLALVNIAILAWKAPRTLELLHSGSIDMLRAVRREKTNVYVGEGGHRVCKVEFEGITDSGLRISSRERMVEGKIPSSNIEFPALYLEHRPHEAKRIVTLGSVLNISDSEVSVDANFRYLLILPTLFLLINFGSLCLYFIL